MLFFRNDNEKKKEKMSFKAAKYGPSIGDMGAGIGSDCWIVGGNFTESGKPMMACDPHLIKWLSTKWYLTSLTWGDGYFMAGGSIPGLPIFTYARSKYASWGVTALNPDVTDIFVEKVEGDKYFYDNEWH